MNLAFERYIGIDYSGAKTPKSSLKGLRVYAADRLTAPRWLESAPESLGGYRGLPCAVEQDFPKRRANAGPARRLCYRQMVATGGR
jgi:hypothetical protein